MGYRVAICDDEKKFRDQIRVLLQAKEQFSQIDEYDSGQELMRQIREGKEIDIIFMDVDMPDMQGTDAVSQIKALGVDVAVCFVTSYEQYAYRAFQVDAMDYIVKPVTQEAMDTFLQKAFEWLEYHKERKRAEDHFLTIQINQRTIAIDMEDIVFIEKSGNACVIHTQKEEITCYETLKNLYPKLNQSLFAYIHQGYIVNFMYVKEIRNNTAFMGNGIELPISRKHIGEARRRLTEKIAMYRMKLKKS